MTKETFPRWANRLSETSSDRDMLKHLVCIAMDPFNAKCFVNDKRYCAGDDVPEHKKPRKERKNNVEFYQTDYPSRAISSWTHMLRAIGTLRNLEFCEELLVYFGNTYEFN